MDDLKSDVPVHLLREHLRRDAPQREQSLVRVLAPLCGAVLVAMAIQAPFLTASVVVSQFAFVLPLVAWYLALLFAFRRGWYRPWVSTVNVVVEASIPTVSLGMQAWQRGGEYALTSSLHLAWPVLLALSCLRMRPALSLMAGALAAVEYALLYALYLRPMLPPEVPLVTLSWVGIGMRVFYLGAAGVVAAAVARQLLRKAEIALHHVRAQDLMSKYFLHEPLGSGGMAEVFRATYSPEGGFAKPVAVKRVLPQLSADEAFIKMFRDEAILCSTLHHPNIVQVLDIGKFEGRYILAMELVDGLSLQKLIQGGARLPFNAVVFLAHQLASALGYLHTRTGPNGERVCIIHHDVNPPNILVSRVGEVKLADFGVARAARHVPGDQQVILRGKKSYLAPEQVQGLPLDGRVDLFCLGLTLHATLTGKHALRGTFEEVVLKLVREPVPPVREVRPDVPAELDAIITRLLRRDLDERTRSGAQLCAELEALPAELAPSVAGQRELATAVQGMVGQLRERAALQADATIHDDQATARED